MMELSAVLHRMKGQKSLSDKKMFEQIDECSEGVGQTDPQGNSILGTRNSKYKSFKAVVCRAH